MQRDPMDELIDDLDRVVPATHSSILWRMRKKQRLLFDLE